MFPSLLTAKRSAPLQGRWTGCWPQGPPPSPYKGGPRPHSEVPQPRAASGAVGPTMRRPRPQMLLGEAALACWRGEGLSTTPLLHIPSMNGPLHKQSEQLTIHILPGGSGSRSCGWGREDYNRLLFHIFGHCFHLLLSVVMPLQRSPDFSREGSDLQDAIALSTSRPVS